MLTEHALLNDSGGEGHRRIRRRTASRARSPRCSRSAARRRPIRCRPIRSCARSIVERRDLERRVEALKLLKGSMPADRYASELEKLVTELALKTRADPRARKEIDETGADRSRRWSCWRPATVAWRRGLPALEFGDAPEVARHGAASVGVVRRQRRVRRPAVFVRIRFDTGFGAGLAGARQPRRAAVGARLSDRRHAPDEDPQGADVRCAAHRRLQRPHARRSGALRLSDRLHVGAGVLDDVGCGSEGAAQLPAQGRVHHLRRLPRRTTGTTSRSR